MKIVYPAGDARHEQYQGLIADEIARTLRDHLQRAGLAGDDLRSLVTSIAFDVAAIVDGSTSLSTEDDDSPLMPILGFAVGRMRNLLMLAIDGGGSSLHEFVPGAVDEAFGDAAS